MAEVRLFKSDLPPNHRGPIKDAIELLYKRHVTKGSEKKNKNVRRGEFAEALKISLDESFGTHWHVLVGEKLGFACKKRNQTMAVFKAEESMIVIWQSPGIEEPEPASPPGEDATKKAEADGGEAEEKKAEEKVEEKKAKAAQPAPTIKVLEPAQLEEGSTRSQVVAALRSELEKSAVEGDTQALAQALRKRLTDDFGTIWHVATGNDFVLEAAENRRNHVLMSVNKMRIVCFQHEQFKGGTNVDWKKLFRTIPYLLLAIMCFGYMTLNSVCNDESPDPSHKIRQSIRTKFCQGDWENNMQYLGGAALVFLFLGRRAGRSASLLDSGGKAKSD